MYSDICCLDFLLLLALTLPLCIGETFALWFLLCSWIYTPTNRMTAVVLKNEIVQPWICWTPVPWLAQLQTIQPQTFRKHWAWGEELTLKLKRRKSVQATKYLSASAQFEQKQSKSKHKQGLLECQVLIEIITKSEFEIHKSCSRAERSRSLFISGRDY